MFRASNQVFPAPGRSGATTCKYLAISRSPWHHYFQVNFDDMTANKTKILVNQKSVHKMLRVLLFLLPSFFTIPPPSFCYNWHSTFKDEMLRVLLFLLILCHIFPHSAGGPQTVGGSGVFSWWFGSSLLVGCWCFVCFCCCLFFCFFVLQINFRRSEGFLKQRKKV